MFRDRCSYNSSFQATSTEIVLLITKRLRSAVGVNGAFVEFIGPATKELSTADRSTIAGMCPEYGALIGFWPADEETLRHLSYAERDPTQVN